MKQQEVEDRRVARICMVVANCHRDPKKRAYRESDFMPRRTKAKSDKPAMQTPDQMLAMLMAWNAASGGKEVISGN